MTQRRHPDEEDDDDDDDEQDGCGEFSVAKEITELLSDCTYMFRVIGDDPAKNKKVVEDLSSVEQQKMEVTEDTTPRRKN